MVTGFLTPSLESNSVYPPKLRKEIKKLFGKKKYMFDVGEFTAYKRMTDSKLLKKTYEMTKMHFKLMNYLIDNSKWDFFITEIIRSSLSSVFSIWYMPKLTRMLSSSRQVSGE